MAVVNEIDLPWNFWTKHVYERNKLTVKPLFITKKESYLHGSSGATKLEV